MRTALIQEMIERCTGMDIVQANVRVLQGARLSPEEYATIRAGITAQATAPSIRQALLDICIKRIIAGQSTLDGEGHGCALTDAEKVALAAQLAAVPVAKPVAVATPQSPRVSASKRGYQHSSLPKAHDFIRRTGNLCTDQHGCAGTLDDSRTLNGKMYFHWRGDAETPNRIFTLTLDEAEHGFRITESDGETPRYCGIVERA